LPVLSEPTEFEVIQPPFPLWAYQYPLKNLKRTL
jgi:hypothetical protein